MEISDFLRPENVTIDLAAVSKARLLQVMASKASRSLGINEAEAVTTLLAREKLGSTGLGDGIAIPHARIASLRAPSGMLARLDRAIDFEAIDGIAVDIVFLLLMPADTAKDHLNVLACAARQLRSRDVTARIRAAATAEEVYEALIAPRGPK